MELFRWNGTDLTQFTTITTAGTITVSGGKIVLTASPGNHNKDTLAFYPERQYGSTVGMSLEYDWEVNDLGPGDGFPPNHIIIITNNASDAGDPIPFPSWRSGLGAWYDQGTDPDHWEVVRDQNHNPATISPTLLVANTSYHIKHSIASDGKHTISINGDNFVTNLGPTTSGGNYASIIDTGNLTQNNDFNNTTNPLTVTGALTTYTGGYAFRDTCFHLTPIPGKYWLLDGALTPTEQIMVTAINGNDVTFARGQAGTPITAFPNGRGIYAVQELYIYFQNQTGSIISKFSNIVWTDDGNQNPSGQRTKIPRYLAGYGKY